MSLGLVFAATLACTGPDGSPNFVKAIIGEDNRQPTADSALARLIGQLKVGETTCTAFASASNEITTAGHCVSLDDNFQPSAATFKAADGTSYDLTELILLDAKKDIAVFKVQQQFPTYLRQSPLLGGSLSLAAIDPNTGILTSDRTCNYEKTIGSAGAIVHSCDTVPGESGAPLMQDGNVVGVHVGYKESLDRNVAFDLRRLNDETVDMLSLDLRKEGCHSRAHVRGGFGGHVRAHVRDCLPDLPSIDEIKANIVHGTAKILASQSGAWTTTSCKDLWKGVVLGAIALSAESMCGGASSGVCAASGGALALGGGLVEAVCTQLCQDHQLEDCK
jgi:hypothetical protein